MNNVIKWLQGFMIGIKSVLSYTRVTQEGWHARVLNGKETYESFWSWQRGCRLGFSLRNKF